MIFQHDSTARQIMRVDFIISISIIFDVFIRPSTFDVFIRPSIFDIFNFVVFRLLLNFNVSGAGFTVFLQLRFNSFLKMKHNILKKQKIRGTRLECRQRDHRPAGGPKNLKA